MALVSLFYNITLTPEEAIASKLFPDKVIVPVPLMTFELEIDVMLGLVMLSLYVIEQVFVGH